MLSSRTVAVVLLMTPPAPSVLAQRSESTASLLLRFDNEHDLSAKEHLLLTVTNKDAGAGPSLLRLAESTTNSDTRWMAMRGMATLRYTACAPFLEASLKDFDALVRANAARALGDLRIGNASDPLLAMFATEKEPPAIQQASLALRMLNIKAAAPYIREKISALDRNRECVRSIAGHVRHREGTTGDSTSLSCASDAQHQSRRALHTGENLCFHGAYPRLAHSGFRYAGKRCC